MKFPEKSSLFMLILGGLVYSILSWAYITDRMDRLYMSKEVGGLILDELHYIRTKLDNLELSER